MQARSARRATYVNDTRSTAVALGLGLQGLGLGEWRLGLRVDGYKRFTVRNLRLT